MEKLHISFIKDLKNSEFYLLFKLLQDLLDKNTSDNATLKRATEKIKSHQDKLVKLRDTKPRHYLTKVIKTKVQNRTEYLACLRLRIDAALLSPIPEERIAGERLKLWMSPYKKDIHKPTITVQSQVVKSLMHDREESEDIQRFTALLNLDGLLKTIMNVTTDVKRLFIKRIKDKTRKSVDGKKVREAAYNDFQLLIQIMEVSYRLSVDNEEKEQITELSQLINDDLTSFRKELKSRKTKRKNKKKREKEASIAKELIEGKEEEQKSNLPMVIYDGLSLNGMSKACNSSLPEPTYRSTIPMERGSEKKEADNGKHNAVTVAKKLLRKENKRKGGDGKLMPVSREIKFESS